MYERASPSDSSHPEFFFHTRMMATNPNEPLEPVTSAEQEAEEVFEIEFEAKEVISTLSLTKNKGNKKLKAQENLRNGFG